MMNRLFGGCGIIVEIRFHIMAGARRRTTESAKYANRFTYSTIRGDKWLAFECGTRENKMKMTFDCTLLFGALLFGRFISFFGISTACRFCYGHIVVCSIHEWSIKHPQSCSLAHTYMQIDIFICVRSLWLLMVGQFTVTHISAPLAAFDQCTWAKTMIRMRVKTIAHLCICASYGVMKCIYTGDRLVECVCRIEMLRLPAVRLREWTALVFFYLVS